MARIVWTDEAERWLCDICEVIAADNPAAAFETVHGISDRAQILAEFPEVGYQYSASTRDVRILLYRRYRMPMCFPASAPRKSRAYLAAPSTSRGASSDSHIAIRWSGIP
jgi:toxin ParE1/3/4